MVVLAFLLILKWMHILNASLFEAILIALAIKFTQYVIEE